MKKLSYILAFAIIIGLTACNAKTPSTQSNVDSAIQSNTAQQQVTENSISYLPTYDNAKLQNISQPDQNKMVTVKYLIKNTTVDKVLSDYGDKFKNEGWTINWYPQQNNPQKQKPTSAYCVKGQHVAALVPQQTGNDVLLMIGTK